MDKNLKTPKERIERVEQLLSERSSPPSSYDLEKYADYIIESSPDYKEKILTNNRLYTINKRETSYEGLSTKFEGGEDTLQNIINRFGDKNVLLTPKISITEKDIAEVPCLKQLRTEIAKLEEQIKNTTDIKKIHLLKKFLIEMRKDQYVLKTSYYHNIRCINLPNLLDENFHLTDYPIEVTKGGEIIDNNSFSFFNPLHIYYLIYFYSYLAEQVSDNVRSDIHYLLADFNNLAESALKDHPILLYIVELKKKKKEGKEIRKLLIDRFQISYSLAYISTLFTQKIPKIIAEKAIDDYLDWHFTYKEKGKWKKCSCCGEIKLAIPRYFSTNKSAKDGYYSICKDCRKNKRKGGK